MGLAFRRAGRVSTRSAAAAADPERCRIVLEQAPLFCGLPPALLRELFGRAVWRRLAEREFLYCKNDPADFVALVVEGRIYTMLSGPDGRELIVDAAGAGQAVGEIALVDPHRRHYTAMASGETEVLVLRRVHLLPLMVEPVFIERVLAGVADSMKRTVDALETLCLYSLESRLARHLLGTAKRDATCQLRVTLPPTQSILAAMLNASRPKLNALLQDWQRAGLIVREGDQLRIDGLSQLRRKAYLA